MRYLFKTLVFSALSLVLSAPATLLADTVTYNLVLTPASGSLYGGTGSITLEGAPSATGLTDYTVANGKLDNVDIRDRRSNLHPCRALPATRLFEFLDGELNDITFAETIGASPTVLRCIRQSLCLLLQRRSDRVVRNIHRDTGKRCVTRSRAGFIGSSGDGASVAEGASSTVASYRTLQLISEASKTR